MATMEAEDHDPVVNQLQDDPEETPVKPESTLNEDELPPFRLAYLSYKLGCQNAACKQAGSTIDQGELCLVSQRWNPGGDFDGAYIQVCRHWRCITPEQINLMKEYTEDDPSKVTGYDGLSVEGREQLYQAFEEGKIVDPTFKDTRKIKNSNSPYLKYDVFDAEGFSVSVAKRAAMCRDEDCKSKGVKVTKGQLRLGIVIPYDGEANTVHYKHWKCVTSYELGMAKLYHEKNRLSGLDDLPDEMKTAVRDSFLRGNIVEPALPEAADPAPKKKKSAKKGTGKDEGNTNVSTTEKAKKRVSNKDTGSDVDTVPQKKAKKGRGVVKKKSAI